MAKNPSPKSVVFNPRPTPKPHPFFPGLPGSSSGGASSSSPKYPVARVSDYTLGGLRVQPAVGPVKTNSYGLVSNPASTTAGLSAKLKSVKPKATPAPAKRVTVRVSHPPVSRSSVSARQVATKTSTVRSPAPRPKGKTPAKAPRQSAAATQTTGGGGNVGLFGGIGPNAYIQNLYAPLEQQNQTQQAQRLAALQGLLSSFTTALQQPGVDYYGAAASDATTAANNAAQSLAAANPNAATQAMLRAIGAPQAQQDQVASQNNTVFNGQGALQQYVSGAIPAGVFAADAQARGDYLKSLPVQLASIGSQGVNQLAATAAKENQALALQKLQDLQKARTDLADYVTKNQSNRIAEAATLGSVLGYIPAGLLGNNKPVNTAKTQAGLDAANRPNSSLSKLYGYIVNSNGDAIPGADGKPQPLTTPPAARKANASLSKALGYVVDDSGKAILKNGKRINLAKSSTKKTMSANEISRQKSLALGAARTYHQPWTDKNGNTNPPLTWQQYLTHGESAGIDVGILIAQGKRIYTPAEIAQGLIPGSNG